MKTVERTPRRVLGPTEIEPGRGGILFRDVPGAVPSGIRPNFEVFADVALGARGLTIAQSILGSCERDYETVRGFFGDADLPGLPVRVVISRLPEDARAFHYEDCCDVYCDALTTPTLDPRYTAFLLVSQLVELFMEAIGRGWRSDASHGEALSRVLAAAMYPRQITSFASAAAWLNSSRSDFVNHSAATDCNTVAVGCGTLFLNYLHHQLGFPWNSIVLAGGPTLADTYHRLSGELTDPFPPFAVLLESQFAGGAHSELTTDNVFPLTGKNKPSALAIVPPPRPVPFTEGMKNDSAQAQDVIEAFRDNATEMYSQ